MKMRFGAKTISACVLASGILSLHACSWSRFSDLKQQASVEAFSGSSQVGGFGQQMSTVQVGSSTRLLVSGQPYNETYAAAYDVASDTPATDSYDLDYCGPGCFLGTPTSMKNVASDDGTQHATCFVYGAGFFESNWGLLGRCGDGKKFRFDVPSDSDLDVGNYVIRPAFEQGLVREGFIAFQASHDDNPLLAASAASLQGAWVYPFGSTKPTDLKRPDVVTKDKTIDFGSSVTVAALAGGGHMVFVGAPKSGSLWLYKLDASGKAINDAKPWGCIAGMTKDFGRYLHTGQLFGDETEELFVSDSRQIRVFDVNALAAGPMGEACSVLYPTTALVSSLVCKDTESVSGCSMTGDEFGRAIALGDLDGDGQKEVLVGAPSLSTPIARTAGAVLVYRVTNDGKAPVILETRYVTSADEGDGLGYSVAALHIGNRDVIAAGSPGSGSFYVFFCSSLGKAGSASSRCN